MSFVEAGWRVQFSPLTCGDDPKCCLAIAGELQHGAAMRREMIRASNLEVGIPSNIEVEVAAALQTRSGPTESTLPGEKSDRVPGGANL
jgi:hypothetical protein